MQTVPTPAGDSPPPLNDAHDLTPVVLKAVRAMWDFAGYRLTVDDAEVLLPMWQGYDDLTDDDFTAVIERFRNSGRQP